MLGDNGIDKYRAMYKKKAALKDNGIVESSNTVGGDKGDLIAGTLAVDEQTKVLLPSQSYMVIGREDPNNGDVQIFALLTSHKGNKTGIAGMTHTTKLSETQPLSDSKPNKAQYAQPIVPPLKVNSSDFKQGATVTAWVNDPKIESKLQPLVSNASRYQRETYNTLSVSSEHLSVMLQNSLHSDSETDIQSNLKTIKDNELAQNKSINSNNNNDKVD